MSLQFFIHLFNHAIGRTLSGPLRLVHVVEYPKCGGTWVARLLRSYYGVDRSFGLTSLTRPRSVIQEHCLHRPWYRRPVVVVRDPRDVWVSFYFHETHYVPSARVMKAIRFDPAAGNARNFAAYVRFKLENPLDSDPGFSYAGFLESWIGRPRVTVVSYEDLHSDTTRELSRVLCGLGDPPCPERVAASIAQNSFHAVTGRQPGDEDRSCHKRKGIVGDWKNHFTPELADFVLQHQGALMKRLGYATDERPNASR